MKDVLEKLSNYFLILEALNDGNAGFLPREEPISKDKIFSELRRRTGLDIEDSDAAWSSWFISEESGAPEIERSNLMMFLKTQKSMQHIMERVEHKIK